MVALKGKGWALAPSLVALVDQVDSVAPARTQVSDGSIGDKAHQTRESDHNPSNGYVTALDLTHDPLHGFDSYGFAEMLRQRKDPRVKYVISNGQWFQSTGSNAWKWKKYKGDPHTNHVHVSVFPTDDGLGNTDSWFDAPNASGGGERRTLRIGVTGDDVKDVQYLLATAQVLPGGQVDGIFGPNTQRGVKEWQRRLGVTVDGVWGPETQGATEKFLEWVAATQGQG